MTPNPTEFRRGVIAPMGCLKEGWAGVKDQYWLFLGIVFIGAFVGGAVPIVLFGPMMCGVWLCLLRKLRGESVEFGMLFKGFDYFVPGLVAAAIQFVPMFIVAVPFYIVLFIIMMSAPSGHVTQAEASDYLATIFIWYLVFMLVILVVSFAVMIFFLFPYALIVDRKLSGLDAIKLSIKAGSANFGGILGLLLLNFLLILVGVLACYVGAFFTMPISFASYATAYRKIFGDPPQASDAFQQPLAA
jgi:hypothetical protein